MKVVVALLAVVGCKSSTDNLPVEPGGGGGTIGVGGHPDAPRDVGGDGGGLAGRVCLLTDPRDLVGCDATNAGGLTVTLGTQMATTAADGSFAMTAPTGTGLVWHVTGTAIQTSVRPYAAGDTQIPAMTTTMYTTVAADTGDFAVGGDGTIFIAVDKAGASLAGATASSSPTATYLTFYDGSTIHNWQTTSTGPFGTALIGGQPAGTATVAVVPPSAATISVTGVPVEDGALTFLTVTAP